MGKQSEYIPSPSLFFCIHISLLQFMETYHLVLSVVWGILGPYQAEVDLFALYAH